MDRKNRHIEDERIVFRLNFSNDFYRKRKTIRKKANKQNQARVQSEKYVQMISLSY